MRRALCLSLVFAATPPVLPAQDKKPPTAQVQRGRDLFTKSPKGIPCGTCHSLAGVGTAIGPDLTTLASAVGSHGLAMSIRVTAMAYVQEVQTSSATFPGMLKQKQGDEIEIWDLSQTPPAIRKYAAKDVLSMKANQTWKHPPASAGYTSQEMADLVGFLKWAATGSAKEVKIEDVEDAK
jgi:mono/diheme cytochrome c family protein